jgi:hypothetical protein
MTRRVFAYLFPSLWRSSSGEVVADDIVWAQEPSISISPDHKHLFIDTDRLMAVKVVLTHGSDAFALAPHELLAIFKILKRIHR